MNFSLFKKCVEIKHVFLTVYGTRLSDVWRRRRRRCFRRSVSLSLISQLIQISAIKLIMNMLAWLVQRTFWIHTHTHTHIHQYT